MFLIYFIPTLIIALGLSFFAVIFVRACGTRTRGDMRRVVVWSILLGSWVFSWVSSGRFTSDRSRRRVRYWVLS